MRKIKTLQQRNNKIAPSKYTDNQVQTLFDRTGYAPSSEYYIGLDVDTEYYTHTYTSDGLAKTLPSIVVSKQTRGITTNIPELLPIRDQFEDFIEIVSGFNDPIIHPATGVLIEPRHPYDTSGFPLIHMLQTLNIKASLEYNCKLKGNPRYTNAPVIDVFIFWHYGTADIFKWFGGNAVSTMINCLNNNQITDHKKNIQFHIRHTKGRHFVNYFTPDWLLTIEDTDYKVRFTFNDSCPALGGNSLYNTAKIVGIDMPYKDLMGSDIENMLTASVERPQDFDAYAKGDLISSDIILRASELRGVLENDLGMSDGTPFPMCATLGSSVASINTNYLVDRVLTHDVRNVLTGRTEHPNHVAKPDNYDSLLSEYVTDCAAANVDPLIPCDDDDKRYEILSRYIQMTGMTFDDMVFIRNEKDVRKFYKASEGVTYPLNARIEACPIDSVAADCDTDMVTDTSVCDTDMVMRNIPEKSDTFIAIINSYPTIKEYHEHLFFRRKPTQNLINDFIDRTLSPYSTKSFAKKVDSTLCLLAKVDGGRLVRKSNKPSILLDGQLCDIDISGAYNTAMCTLPYAVGTPVEWGYGINRNMFAPLGTFLKLNYDHMVPGLWVARISTRDYILEYPQDIIPSFTNVQKRNQIDVTMLDSDANASLNFDISNSYILNHQIINGILTSDVLDLCRAVMSREAYKELLEQTHVVACMYYPKNQQVSDSLTFCNKTRMNNPFNRETNQMIYTEKSEFFGEQTILKKETTGYYWYDVDMSSLPKELHRLRNQFPKGSTQNLFYKLIANTLYGTEVSKHFAISNSVMGNNITARVRCAVYLFEKALNTEITITDGGIFDLNRVTIMKTSESQTRNFVMSDGIKKVIWDEYKIGDRHSGKYIGYGTLPGYTPEKDHTMIAALSKQHTINTFPKMESLIGLFNLEVKGTYTKGCLHGAGDYKLINEHTNEVVIKARSYKGCNAYLEWDHDSEEYKKTGNTPQGVYFEAAMNQKVSEFPVVNNFTQRDIYTVQDYCGSTNNDKPLPGETYYTHRIFRPYTNGGYTFGTDMQLKYFQKCIDTINTTLGIVFENPLVKGTYDQKVFDELIEMLIFRIMSMPIKDQTTVKKPRKYKPALLTVTPPRGRGKQMVNPNMSLPFVTQGGTGLHIKIRNQVIDLDTASDSKSLRSVLYKVLTNEVYN